jgi:flagellar protein FlaJ
MSEDLDDKDNKKEDINPNRRKRIGELLEQVEEDSGSSGLPSSDVGKFIDRIAYSIFGGLYRGRENNYENYNRKLNQARIPVSYDIYLSRVMMLSIISAILGVLLGFFISINIAGLLLTFEASITFPEPIASFIETYEFGLIVITLSLVGGLLLFIIVYLSLYYYPYYIANERKRKIDTMLPYSVTFQYAMSRGGVNVLGVIRAISNAGDAYGEVSEEYKAIVRNVDYVKKDLRTSVLEEALETPSSELKNFLEDLLNVIDTGSNMESFFKSKSDLYLEKAKNQQQQLLETIQVMSEVYVIVFVAAPILVLVVLVVMNFVGSGNITALYAMTYIGVPAGGLIFTVLIKIISSSGQTSIEDIKPGEESYMKVIENKEIDEDKIENEEGYERYKKNKRWETNLTSSRGLYKTLIERPYLSFLITIPIAALVILNLHLSGVAEVSIEAFQARPVWNTLSLIHIPIVGIVLGVYMILYELGARREARIMKKLPEVLKSASDANDRGLGIEESFKLVAKNSGGELADELEKSMNQTTWTGDLNGALTEMANNIKIPRLSRTIKVLTKANEVSGNIKPVLKVVARDVENQRNLAQDRKTNAYIYLIIIFLSFLVSLSVIVMLDTFFLSRIVDNENLSGGSQLQGIGLGGGFPIQEYRLNFLHITYLLGGASGIVGGTLANNKAASGIKYSMIMMSIALLVFALF